MRFSHLLVGLAGVLCLFMLFGLTACSTGGAKTPAQALFAAKSDYRVALTAMVAYKDHCVAKPVEQKLGCDVHVAKLQELDNKAYDALQKAESLAGTPNQTLAVTVAETALKEAYAYLAKAQLKQKMEIDR